jgi:hypothetical protein
MAKNTKHVVIATPDQVDEFGNATIQINEATKVRKNLINQVFKPSSDSGNTHWAGQHYQVTASEKNLRRLDIGLLVEELQKRGITDANVLVESCHTDSTITSFRSTVLVGRLTQVINQRATLSA